METKRKRVRDKNGSAKRRSIPARLDRPSAIDLPPHPGTADPTGKNFIEFLLSIPKGEGSDFTRARDPQRGR
jgi:hypothetical protein